MLQDKVAIVTGASRGIGREIALHFARNGAKLAILGRDRVVLEKLANCIVRENGHEPLTIEADLNNFENADSIIERVLSHFNQMDVLVNAAGMISRSRICELDTSTHVSVFNVNVHAPIFLSKAVIPFMAANNGGSIINITSQMARTAHPSAAISYESSKAALMAATRHLAYHYANMNVRVNSIAPGSIETDMLNSMNQESLENLRKKVPMGRFGNTSEVASVAVFLASDMSTYITGATIDVNGGSWMP